MMQCVGLAGVLITFLVLIGNAVTTVAGSGMSHWTGTGIAFGASLPLVLRTAVEPSESLVNP